MPEREDEYRAMERKGMKYCPTHRRYYRPDYGCQACRYEHMVLKEKLAEKPRLQTCPECRRRSLYWNQSSLVHECLNRNCRHKFSQEEYAKWLYSKGIRIRGVAPKPTERKGPLWKIVSWLSRPVARVKGGIRRSIPKSFRALRQSRWLLVALGLAVIFIGIGYYPSLFGETGFANWMEIPVEVFGAILVLIGLFSESHRSRMNTARGFLVLLILFTAGSYAYQYLDERGKIDEWLGRTSEKIPSLVGVTGGLRWEVAEPTPTPTEPPPQFTPAPSPLPTTSAPSVPETSRVWIGNAYLVGGDGKPVILENYPNTRNPSWNQLVSFLEKDPTDKNRYVVNAFVCSDFAEMLHNNAEEAGWRSAYVCINVATSEYGHALNAFETTDRGIVYIDCTAPLIPSGSADKVVEVKVGQDYVPRSVFPEPGWQSTWENLGRVTEIDVMQW
jgi:hypothetical protein